MKFFTYQCLKIENWKLKILLAAVALSFLATNAKAAVPTFDVGLNPKMDALLIKTEDIRVMTRNIQCMISNLHKKEYGPPPVGCSGEGSLLSGLGSLGGIFNKISSIAGSVFGGSNFGGASGPDIGNPSAPFDWSQDSAEWLDTDFAGGQSTFNWSQDSAEWLVTDSAGTQATFDWGQAASQDSGEWLVTDSSGGQSTFDWSQDSAEWLITDSSGGQSTFDWSQDSAEWLVTDSSGTYTVDSTGSVIKDSAGNPVTSPSIMNRIKDALKKISSIKSLVKAVTGGGGLSSLTRSLDSLMGKAASIFGACDSLDCMARKMAEMAQGFLQQQILNWIRTGAVSNAGGSGRSLFVRDWDRYLLDAANYASSIFLGELQGTQLCEPFGSELKRIFSTGGGFSVGALSGGGFGGGVSAGSGGSRPFNQILNCNLNSVTRNYQPFFDDIENGGWEAWGELTQPKINPFSQYMIIAEEEEIREARAVQAARLEAESGQGFLGDKQCVEREITLPPDDFGEYEGGTQTYQDCPIVTPGIIQKEVTAKVAVSEQEKLQDVHEMKELFDTILRQMVQSILFSAGGLFSGSFSADSGNPPPPRPTITPTPPGITPTPAPTPPVDTTLPVIRSLRRLNNGNIDVIAYDGANNNGAGRRAIASVEFFLIDSAGVETGIGSGEISGQRFRLNNWDSTGFSGDFQLIARATDRGGNVSAIDPPINITLP